MSGTEREIAAKVDEVVLLEDRAHVYRRGRAALTAGRNRLIVSGVAPVLADKTLAVGAEGPGVTVVSARIVRRERFGDPEVDDTPRGELERQQRELADRIAELDGERAVVRRHARGLTEIVALAFDELGNDVAWGRDIGSEWSARLAELRGREATVRERLVEMDHELEKLEQARARLDHRLAVLSDPSVHAHAAIEVDLDSEGETDVELRLDYVVPGACWRPYHTATLTEDGAARVVLATDACVWQRTGEDWTDTQLVFSTERASLGTSPPPLSTDLLSWRKKEEHLVVEARQQVVATTGLGVAAAAQAPELPGIDDGGEALNLRAAARSDVPSDGQPYRVRIGEMSSPCDVALVAFPELSACVFTRTTQTNRAPRPILAGPVDLVRSSGYVGRTSILYVAPDERFDLGWGPEAELRIRRTDDPRKAKTRVLSSWVTQERAIEIKLSNIGDTARQVEVSERVPVSEIEKVKIELDGDKTSSGSRPDANGFVAWKVSVPPFGHETISLAYTVKKHEDVVGL